MDRQQWCCIWEFLFWYIGAALCSSGFKLNSNYVSACAIQSPWIYPRPVTTTPLPWSLLRLVSSTVRDTCCAHGFKAPSEFPLLLLASCPLHTLVMRQLSPAPALLCLFLSPFSFSFPPFVFFVPFWCPCVHYCSSLKCTTSNTTTVQVEYFTAPCKNTHTDTCTLTNRARAVEWSSCQGD